MPATGNRALHSKRERDRREKKARKQAEREARRRQRQQSNVAGVDGQVRDETNERQELN